MIYPGRLCVNYNTFIDIKLFILIIIWISICCKTINRTWNFEPGILNFNIKQHVG
jgi:hypothetical protein